MTNPILDLAQVSIDRGERYAEHRRLRRTTLVSEDVDRRRSLMRTGLEQFAAGCHCGAVATVRLCYCGTMKAMWGVVCVLALSVTPRGAFGSPPLGAVAFDHEGGDKGGGDKGGGDKGGGDKGGGEPHPGPTHR